MVVISKELREVSQKPWFPIMMRELGYEPVKHGRDLIGDTLFECSECGYYNDDTTRGTTRTFNYCPNCGAKMDEVTE